MAGLEDKLAFDERDSWRYVVAADVAALLSVLFVLLFFAGAAIVYYT
jgi:hypothetical protein